MDNVKITKRICAYLIDILLVAFIFSLITMIRFINPYYDKYLEVSTQYNGVLEKYYDSEITAMEMVEKNTENFYYLSKYSAVYSVVSIVILIGYFVFFQKYNHGQTIGSKLMHLKVINTNGEEGSIKNFLLRTLFMYYLEIGSIIPITLNLLVLLFVKSSSYLMVNAGITYVFSMFVIASIITLLVRKDKRGLHEIISNTKVVNA